MSTLELSFASGASLAVHEFSVREAVSDLFTLSILARSPDPAVDLEALVGHEASFHLAAGYTFALGGGERRWSGVVARAELVHAVTVSAGRTGLSTYQIRVVPALWKLTQRRNHRVFQHLSIPDIVARLLGEWGIEARFAVDRAAYPKLLYKVQYGESDYAFVSRLLEEAGIAFTFAEGDAGSVVTFGDRLEQAELRQGSPIPFVDAPNASLPQEMVTAVRIARELRPGALLFRDFDFRRPGYPLVGEAPKEGGPEARYEQMSFDQGAFLIEEGQSEDTPVADDKAVARHVVRHGEELAKRGLLGARVGARSVVFNANTFDVAPGTVLSIDQHPHPAIPASKRLLVLETRITGTSSTEWKTTVRAVPADVAHRPARRTPKPVVRGLSAAVVVGPKGQEIHTDELGRVRVQFPWDREGKNDDDSSCWVRVSEPWGGAGFGTVTLPRIGQEVLVSFLDGDPDQPMIAGRVYNAVQQVPYKLPQHRTRSTWKSDSSLGSGGFNEIMFEDAAKEELVWAQAQKDRQRLVKHDEFITVGHDRQKLVKHDESERTEGYKRRWVGGNADLVTVDRVRERIEGGVHTEVRGNQVEGIDGDASLVVVQDRHERVDGRLALRASKQIHLVAGEAVTGEAADTTVRGPGGFLRIDASGVTISGTVVKINAGGAPGEGPGAHPEPPEEPKQDEPDPPLPPFTVSV